MVRDDLFCEIHRFLRLRSNGGGTSVAPFLDSRVDHDSDFLVRITDYRFERRFLRLIRMFW